MQLRVSGHHDTDALKAARYRLMYDEMFVLQTGLLMMRSEEEEGIEFEKDGSEKKYQSYLPYELTGAQKRVIAEIAADMERPARMNRLVQGDVGSGKTAVAEAVLYKAVRNGFQGAFMAPTELLARQHFHTLTEDFKGLGIDVRILTGHLSAKEKKETLELLRTGAIDILIGTHVLTGFEKCDLHSVQPYVRVLGFNENGAKLLKHIKTHKTASAPVITKIRRGAENDPVMRMDIIASDMYNLAFGGDVYERSDFVMKPYIK